MISSWWQLLKTTVAQWQEDKAPRLGAALAYYTVFSLAPLLIIVTAIVGFVLGPEAEKGQLQQQLESLLGPAGAVAAQQLIASASQPASGITATLLSLGALLLGATAVFGELKDALNTIWEVQSPPSGGLRTMIRDRFLSFAMVVCIGFLLLVSLVISTALEVLGRWMPGPEGVMQIANFCISFAVITTLFALIFKVLPDVEIAWRDVWLGAAITSLLFTLGKYLLGLYLAHATVTSTYGAAGSLVVVLLWTYYSAQILFFGAEFTQAYVRHRGAQVVPARGAVPMSQSKRCQEGLPRQAPSGGALSS